MALAPEQWLNLAAGVVLGALGIVVLAVKPRHPPVLAFALFALSLAALYLVGAATTSVLGLAADILSLTIALGAFGLMLAFPTPIAGAGRRDAALVLSYATGYTLLSAWVEASPELNVLPAAIEVLHRIAFVAAMLLFPLRTRRLPVGDTASARSLAILATGMFLFTAGSTGRAGATSLLDAALDGAYVVVPVALWVVATRGHHGTVASNVVVAAVLIALGALYLNSTSATTYAYPIGRVVAALLLGYAVMRGQVEGLDVKVRFAISKSTIAAVFIAVFFLASELAQQFFGAQFGSAYIGIIAAGALVFALAPLQRAAERLAERAVPTTAVAQSNENARREEIYRQALRIALTDREVSRAEEVHLFQLADELGVRAGRAMELRQEIEAERQEAAA